MRLVLSRKGFDSSAGGCPNPIFPDGSLLALPIPDAHSAIRYRDIRCHQGGLGTVVSQLTNGRVKPSHGAHLDPDLDAASYPRQPGWRPLFGQMGAAQGHLAKQGVGAGDLLLFFGLFRHVERVKRRWRFRPDSRPHHRIWGWFQIASRHPVADLPEVLRPWAAYHPHCRQPGATNNRLYVAGETLDLPGSGRGLAGSGVLCNEAVAPVLSDPDARLPSQWRLPRWFYPERGRRPMSYHLKPERWHLQGDYCHLAAACRGQEFVLQCEDYPPALAWALEIIAGAG